MVDASPIFEGQVNAPTSVPTYYRKWKIIEAQCSTNETIPTTGLGTLVAVAGFRKDTGVAVTCTVATTIITVTATLSDVDCIFLVTGAQGP